MKKMHIIRENLGISQNELAKKVGLSVSTIWKYENDKIVRIKPERIQKIAKILNTTVEELNKKYEQKPLLIKNCMNEICPLNYEHYCQSGPVCNGKPCRNQYNITKKKDKEYKKAHIRLEGSNTQNNRSRG